MKFFERNPFSYMGADILKVRPAFIMPASMGKIFEAEFSFDRYLKNSKSAISTSLSSRQ